MSRTEKQQGPFPGTQRGDRPSVFRLCRRPEPLRRRLLHPPAPIHPGQRGPRIDPQGRPLPTGSNSDPVLELGCRLEARACALEHSGRRYDPV